jgi:cellulose biosynthesis protein BcsQ
MKQKRTTADDTSSQLKDQAVPYAPKRMFSGASFFEVIEARRPPMGSGRRDLGEPSTLPPAPAVVAFYGFRGGAGRTLALAHVAVMLAQRGLRVAALDGDIEAPGLHVALSGETPLEGKGLVPLLQAVVTTDPDKAVNVVDHLQVLSPREGVGKILLLPAGRVTRRYLAQIEELGAGLWHEPERSPLERILDTLRAEHPDVILVDCRTGFNGTSASILFHHADLAVIFVPLTDQVWDGIDVLLEAVASARTVRQQWPALMFVPSMAPSGEPGREKIRRFLTELNRRYDQFLPHTAEESDQEEGEALEDDVYLPEGIMWDPRLSSDGTVRQPFMPGGPWGQFQPLCDRIVAALDLGAEQPKVQPMQIRSILDQLQISGSVGFAEELEPKQMMQFTVASESVKAAVDRASALIVGAKGSGKTLLWRCLLEGTLQEMVHLPGDTQYVVGHAPKPDLDPHGANLSADAFKQLEQDGKLRRAETHKSFWLLYSLFRLAQTGQGITDWLNVHMPSPLRGAWRRLVSASGTRDFAPLLNVKSVATLAEDAFARLDQWLLQRPQQYVLLFDGLDSGFDVGRPETWYQRRQDFVRGLLQVVADWRSRLKRLQFKVFLREDIYLSIDLQNRSHLDTAKHELRFGPRDLWQLALKLATTSDIYRSTMASAKIGPDGLYVGDDNELKGLLYLLWGRTIEAGKKAYTANYILKRTSDAQGRLFPRTFIQMLDAAVKAEKKLDQRAESDRVLRFRSLRQGVIYASNKRTDDLRTEYVELRPYLTALRGAPAVASRKKLIEVMRRAIGTPSINLHMGAGGWSKVFDRLVTVGVLGRKPAGLGEDERFSVAPLYRDGLGMKSMGLR